jgi:hypothetical protein
VSLLLISGRPGAGKSEFCRWLAAHRGFVHIETDVQWSPWGELAATAGASTAGALRDLALDAGPNLALEWGMRMEYLGRVLDLKEVGFEPWWFDGHEPAARFGWIRAHGEAGIRAYEIQRDSIATHAAVVETVFRDRIIRTVSDGPIYLPPEQIAQIVLG